MLMPHFVGFLVSVQCVFDFLVFVTADGWAWPASILTRQFAGETGRRVTAELAIRGDAYYIGVMVKGPFERTLNHHTDVVRLLFAQHGELRPGRRRFCRACFSSIFQQVKLSKHLVHEGTRRIEGGMVSGAAQITVLSARSKHDHTAIVEKDGTIHLRLEDADLDTLQGLQAVVEVSAVPHDAVVFIKTTPHKSIFAVSISTRNSRTGQKVNEFGCIDNK